jgi:hypothetical protein
MKNKLWVRILSYSLTAMLVCSAQADDSLNPQSNSLPKKVLVLETLNPNFPFVKEFHDGFTTELRAANPKN